MAQRVDPRSRPDPAPQPVGPKRAIFGIHFFSLQQPQLLRRGSSHARTTPHKPLGSATRSTLSHRAALDPRTDRFVLSALARDRAAASSASTGAQVGAAAGFEPARRRCVCARMRSGRPRGRGEARHAESQSLVSLGFGAEGRARRRHGARSLALALALAHPNTLRTLRSVSSGTIVLRSAAIARELLIFGRRGILNPAERRSATCLISRHSPIFGVRPLTRGKRRGWRERESADDQLEHGTAAGLDRGNVGVLRAGVKNLDIARQFAASPAHCGVTGFFCLEIKLCRNCDEIVCFEADASPVCGGSRPGQQACFGYRSLSAWWPGSH